MGTAGSVNHAFYLYVTSAMWEEDRRMGRLFSLEGTESHTEEEEAEERKTICLTFNIYACVCLGVTTNIYIRLKM